MKNCTKCKITKELTEFGIRRKHKDGKSYWCKKCTNEEAIARYRTPSGLINRIYGNQTQHSKDRKHNPPAYTNKQLKEWALSKEKYHELFKLWEDSEFNRELAPIIDRIDDSIGYTLDNIQLMTWKENMNKAHSHHKSGVLNFDHKAVEKYTLDNQIIDTYYSVAEAFRQTNVSKMNIIGCCQGKRFKAGGFIWKYKDTTNVILENMLYQQDGDEMCYDLDYWYDQLDYEDRDEIIIVEMKQDKHKFSVKWCAYFGEFLEGGECGIKECSKYVARNGKCGICVHKKHSYTQTGRVIKLTNESFTEIKKSY